MLNRPTFGGHINAALFFVCIEAFSGTDYAAIIENDIEWKKA